MKLESTASPTGEAITISLGIAIYPEHGKDAHGLISTSDQAMYTSKLEGRNRTSLYSNLKSK